MFYIWKGHNSETGYYINVKGYKYTFAKDWKMTHIY
jgi:hypothetical protein